MVPVNALLSKSRSFKSDSNPISDGMVPVNALLSKSRSFKSDSNPTSVGMLPVNELRYKSSSLKLNKFDILQGMLPCKLLSLNAISIIESELFSQVTPYQEHHDSVELNQRLLFIQSSPDVKSYRSFNAFGTGDNEGPKEGITDKEGEEDGIVDNEGLNDGIVDSEGLKDGIVDDESLLAEFVFAELFTINVITTVIKIIMDAAA